MYDLTLLIILAFGYIGFLLYRRERAPDLINEIYNGLINLSFRYKQLDDIARAEQYEKMAKALIDGQHYVYYNRKPSDLNHLNETCRLVLCSMDYRVLEACGIYRQNHKHTCYETVGDLTRQLEKIIKRQTELS